MSYLPWYLGGLALAAVMVGHWLGVGRMMAVSGRFTGLVNRLRFGAPAAEDGAGMTSEELIAAMRAATEAAFGASPLDPPDAPAPAWDAPGPRGQQTAGQHLLFFAALAVGGLASTLLRGGFHPIATLRGESFASLTRGSPALTCALLVGGGFLVGFGTRMAGGCTSGHGLCGLSRFQKGSLLSTAGFFGAGVATSFVLGRLL